MKKLIDAELMDSQFDHWEQLDNKSVIRFTLIQGKSEYYPPQYLTAKNEIKHLELRIDSPATLYIYVQGQPQSDVGIWFLENDQHKILDTIPGTDFGQIHKTQVKSQYNTVFFFFKIKNTGSVQGNQLQVWTSLSFSSLERKIQGLANQTPDKK